MTMMLSVLMFCYCCSVNLHSNEQSATITTTKASMPLTVMVSGER